MVGTEPPSGVSSIAVVGLCVFAASGCNIDTETGVAAEIERAGVSVSGTDEASTVIAVQLDMFFRVGEHAEGTRMFIPFRAELFGTVDDTQVPLAQVPLDRPASFDGVLEPGESETVMLTGQTPAGAFGSARAELCASGAVATVRVTFNDMTASEVDRAQRQVDEIRCP